MAVIQNDFAQDLLSLIFLNDDTGTWVAAIGSDGLGAATTADDFYVSLHTADPGDGGSQNTNETSYTNYVRKGVNRATGASGFRVTAGSPPFVDNNDAIAFAQCGTTGATLTHFGIGTASTGAGKLLFKGALDSSVAVSSGGVPTFADTALKITLE